jgi:hypothetical protein
MAGDFIISHFVPFRNYEKLPFNAHSCSENEVSDDGI